MTITLFEDKDCKGAKKVLAGNIADLKGKDFDKPSSISMSSEDDAVLLFKNDDWRGGVLYLRGPQTVSDLGKGDEGGESGFGNSIRSARVTPFQLDLNVTVVTNGTDMPGDWIDEQHAESTIGKAVAAANLFYLDKQALLHLNIARITFRNSPDKFVVKFKEDFPGSWKNGGELDVIFLDRFADTDNDWVGHGRFPMGGQTVVVAVRPDSGAGDFPVGTLTYVLLHEIGHYLGLSHNTADEKSVNLMFDTLTGSYSDKTLKPSQIEEMHQRLARNITRRGDRG